MFYLFVSYKYFIYQFAEREREREGGGEREGGSSVTVSF